MRVRIDKLAAKLGCAPSESAVTAALAAPDAEDEHDAYMARHFPQVASIRASTPQEANRKRAEAVAFDEQARADPRAIPGSARAVTISPGSRGTPVVTPLPGLGAVRSPGRSIFGHN